MKIQSMFIVMRASQPDDGANEKKNVLFLCKKELDNVIQNNISLSFFLCIFNYTWNMRYSQLNGISTTLPFTHTCIAVIHFHAIDFMLQFALNCIYEYIIRNADKHLSFRSSSLLFSSFAVKRNIRTPLIADRSFVHRNSYIANIPSNYD